ncbi:MAG: DoxX family protein [Chloroflexi bacterium]|nr:DoxX family protein [Chloroflexota bacterium]MCL5274914.1 DoxX family protein [Chloroflexota bacterium]
MTTIKNPTTFRGRTIEDPKIAKFLFSDVRMSWVWLVVRIWLGYQWIDASLHKVTNPAWVTTGEALKGYWANAVKVPEGGKPAIAFGWYRDFLNFLLNAQAYTWFGKLVAYGELLVGIGLVVGAFVGIAAFFGALMNFNFLLAGSASTNGLLLLAALLIVMAWKIAGYIGADYFLLRFVGVPWKNTETEQAKSQASPAASGR